MAYSKEQREAKRLAALDTGDALMEHPDNPGPQIDVPANDVDAFKFHGWLIVE